jgi:hypothetical protein
MATKTNESRQRFPSRWEATDDDDDDDDDASDRNRDGGRG